MAAERAARTALAPAPKGRAEVVPVAPPEGFVNLRVKGPVGRGGSPRPLSRSERNSGGAAAVLAYGESRAALRTGGLGRAARSTLRGHAKLNCGITAHFFSAPDFSAEPAKTISRIAERGS